MSCWNRVLQIWHQVSSSTIKFFNICPTLWSFSTKVLFSNRLKKCSCYDLQLGRSETSMHNRPNFDIRATANSFRCVLGTWDDAPCTLLGGEWSIHVQWQTSTVQDLAHIVVSPEGEPMLAKSIKRSRVPWDRYSLTFKWASVSLMAFTSDIHVSFCQSCLWWHVFRLSWCLEYLF